MELFVSSLIPVVLNLTEEDFEGQNRSAWTNLWAPLVNSSLPNVALLVQPCLQMPKKHRPPTPDECAVWLDIAALHSLSWSYWSDFARVWSLMYLKTRLATLSKVKPIPVIFSSSTSTILSADEGNSSGSFPFAGPIRLEKYLDEQTLNFEVSKVFCRHPVILATDALMLEGPEKRLRMSISRRDWQKYLSSLWLKITCLDYDAYCLYMHCCLN